MLPAKMANSARGSCPKCENGWKYYAGTNSCFKAFDKMILWENAQKECQRLGANLASVHSQAEMDFIMTFKFPSLQNKNVGGFGEGIWLGVRLSDNRSRYSRFIDGKNIDGTPLDYTNFASGEPNYYEGDENCVMYYPIYLPGMRRSYIGKWNDESCGRRQAFGYVCKMSAQTC